MNKKKVMIAAIVLALVLSIGGVLAYFSDSETATNTFTVGSISIQLTETNWDTTTASAILPNQLIPKNPSITNNGNNPAYVFMKVTVPKATVTVEAQDGSGGTSSTQELFELINSSDAVGVNSGWVLIDSDTSGANSNEYIYAYASGTASGNLTTLAKNASTTNPLFNKVRFANVQEGWGIEGTSYNVEVTGYAIQTENLNGIASPTPAQAWAVLNANAIHTP